MFCPKCGEDSGEFKFCPYCGSKIPDEEVKTAVWSMGMACPHCGGTKLEGNNCAFCGAQLIAETHRLNDRKSEAVQIPFGKYKGYHSFLELNEDGILIQNAKHSEHKIPYDGVTSVLLRKERFFCYGWLSLRYTNNFYQPPAFHLKDALQDATTFMYISKEDAVKMKQAYYALKSIVEKNGGTAKYIE